ncbi:hypothetical protein BH23BAC4_BH23BAC4_07940 [soil metagenome]
MTEAVAASRSVGRRPVHLWIVGIVSLLWNSIGAFDYLMTQLQAEWYMGSFSAEQLEYFYGFPAWAVAVWAIGVWFAVGGSVALLLRSRWAVYLFGISLAGLALTTLYTNVLSDGMAAMGGSIGYVIFSIVLWLVLIGLLVYSIAMARRGVLR